MCSTHPDYSNYIYSIEGDPIEIVDGIDGYHTVDVEYLGECYSKKVGYCDIFPFKVTRCCEIIDPDCIVKLDRKVVIKKKGEDCIELDFLEFGKICAEKYRKHPGFGNASRKRVRALEEENAKLIDELNELKKKHQKCDGSDFGGN